MIHLGRSGNYQWLACHNDRVDFSAVLSSCPDVIGGKFVAITSFDSGPLTPSPEEELAGWTFDGRIMYSPRINESIEMPYELYDEWLIFADETRTLPELEVFVNWGVFSLAAGEVDYSEHQARLWEQLKRVGAESYMAEGDYFNFASSNGAVFDCVATAVHQLHAA